MPGVNTLNPRNEEPSPLVQGQKWKLWLFGALLTVAGIGSILPNSIGGVAVKLGALLLIWVSLGWAVYAVRCRYCGLHLVMYAMSNQSIGQWLQWLLTVKRCPKCGADHEGKRH